jgi:hypothetical protein
VVIVAAPCSQWMACSPARNAVRAWPLNSIVSCQPMDIGVAVALALSAVATGYIWWLISRTNDSLPMKLALGVAVAIPVIGPLFWPFLSMPPRHSYSAIFKGPIARNPTRPKWLALSFRALVIAIAVLVAVTHFLFFRDITK